MVRTSVNVAFFLELQSSSIWKKKKHEHVFLVSFSRKILTRTGLTHVESFFLLPKLTEHLLQFFFYGIDE